MQCWTVTRSVVSKKPSGPGAEGYLTTPQTPRPARRRIQSGFLPGASPAAGVTDPQGTECPQSWWRLPVGRRSWREQTVALLACRRPRGTVRRIATLLSLRVEKRPPEARGPQVRQGCPRSALHYLHQSPASAEGADSIEEAASRIVDSVIKASGALMTEGSRARVTAQASQCGPRDPGPQRVFRRRRSPCSLQGPARGQWWQRSLWEP